MQLSQKSINLIVSSEGLDQPWRWPGGGSGITIGCGCDIGADPDSLRFWTPHLTPAQIALLSTAKGVVGRRAAQIASRFRGININRSQALDVFTKSTLPHEIALTLKAFPGIEFMPEPVQGALVSLVFNRGTDITDDVGSTRRREMRIIHEILAEFQTFDSLDRARVQDEYITKIALQLRKMKRLWEGSGLDGLLKRRDAEADLCLSAIS